MIEEMIPVIVVLIVVGIPVICVTLVKITRILKGESYARDNHTSPPRVEEARLMQEMHRTLAKLENRIEAIETIILEHERKKGN